MKIEQQIGNLLICGLFDSTLYLTVCNTNVRMIGGMID